MSYNTGAQEYFDHVPNQWDALYVHENRFKYLMNRFLRKGLYERHRLTFEHCGDLTGKKVLDIGCGTGKYSIECAKRGASRVVGIDFAASMINFSRQIAEQMEVADRCEFIFDDFLTHEFEGSFDVVLALGLFDYIQEAGPLFTRVAGFNPSRFIASFPKFTPLWGFQRTIRYNLIRKCPIYYYKLKQLEDLYHEACFEECLIVPCGSGYLGVAGVFE